EVSDVVGWVASRVLQAQTAAEWTGSSLTPALKQPGATEPGSGRTASRLTRTIRSYGRSTCGSRSNRRASSRATPLHVVIAAIPFYEALNAHLHRGVRPIAHIPDQSAGISVSIRHIAW